MKELLEAQDQTILKMVNEVFKSEEFKDGKLPCPSEDLVEDGCDVLTTANEYEQAIMIAVVKNSNEKKEKAPDMIEDREINALYNLFWESIVSRIGDEHGYDALALKEDWQITGFFRKEADIHLHCLDLI